MINTESQKTKYGIDFTKGFKKQFKKVIKQGKDIKKFSYVVEKLANKENLEAKFILSPEYKNNDKLILLLVAT